MIRQANKPTSIARYLLVVGVLLGGLLTVGCTSNVRPISKICRYNGAHEGTIVKVICTGIGHSQESALIDAKKAATGYVAGRMLQTRFERVKFGSVANGFYNRYNSFIAKVRTDGTYKQDDAGKARVEADIQVRRDQIVLYLTDNGIVAPEQTRKAIGNPTLAVTTKWKTRDPRWESFVRGATNTFLVERRYETVDLEAKTKTLGKLQQRVLQLDGIPVDPKFRAAMMLGADIHIEVTCWNEMKGASIKGVARVKAYETSTARLLGDQTAFGKEYSKSQNATNFQTVKEAIQNATQRVLTQVEGYWKRDAREGNRFFVLFVGNLDKVEDMGEQLIIRLKRFKEIDEVKCPTVTKHRVPCQFRSKKDPVELRLSLKSLVRGAPGVGSMNYLLKTRKFWIASINHGGASKAAAPAKVSDTDSLPPGM